MMSQLVGIDCSDTTAMHLDYGFDLVVLSRRSAMHCCLILRHERGLVQVVHICLGLYFGMARFIPGSTTTINSTTTLGEGIIKERQRGRTRRLLSIFFCLISINKERTVGFGDGAT